MRAIAGQFSRQATGGGNPAGVATHHFQHEHLGAGAGHGSHVEAGFTRGHRHVLGHGAEARAAVRERQVVVDGLGNADAGQRVAHFGANHGQLVGCVHAVIATVIEEIADIVGATHLNEAFVLGPVLLDGLQLVARAAEGPRGRVAQGADGGGGLGRGVDEVFGESPDDAVAPGVELADAASAGPAGLDDATGGGIDDAGDPARLGIKGITRLGGLGGRLDFLAGRHFEPVCTVTGAKNTPIVTHVSPPWGRRRKSGGLTHRARVGSIRIFGCLP